jgi:hypothetical protein
MFTNYYTADFTVKFYILDGKVSAQVVESGIPDTGSKITTEGTEVKRILPDVYKVLYTINDFKNLLPSQPTQSQPVP